MENMGIMDCMAQLAHGTVEMGIGSPMILNWQSYYLKISWNIVLAVTL
jgi:hypothetical protein